MANIPRFCQDCQEVYWGDYYNPVHFCAAIKEEPISFNHFKPKKAKPPKPKKPVYDHKCTVCEQEFKSGHKHRVYCTETCRMKGVNKNKIAAANKRWVDNNPRKKTKYTMGQLNRIYEWKRVWDDESWTKRFNGVRM